MIIELIELYDLLAYHHIHFLILHFITFLLVANFLRRYWCKKSILRTENKTIRESVGIVIPVKNESPNLFKRVLLSVKKTGIKDVVVVADGIDGKIRELTKQFGYTFIKGDEKGKGWAMMKGFSCLPKNIKYVVFLDSDTIINSDSIEKLSKGFYSKEVVGVMGTHYYFGDDKNTSYYFNAINELSRNVVESGLANEGCLSVVDGRFMMWRRDFIEEVRDEFLRITNSEAGDDATLTYLAYKLGYKTNFVRDSIAYICPQPTLKQYIKQQIRWAKTGYKFFPKYLFMKGVSLKNKLHQIFYFLEPFSFTLALILDLLVFNTLPIRLGFVELMLAFVVGNWINHMLTQIILYNKPVNLPKSLEMSLIGIFVIYPIRIYSAFSKKDGKWLTR